MTSSSKVKVLAVFGVMLMIGSALCVLAVADDSVAASPKTYTLELTDNASTSDAKAKDAFGSENATYTYSNNVGTLTLKNTAEFATTADNAISCTVNVVIELEDGCNITVMVKNNKRTAYGITGTGDITIKGKGMLTVDLSESNDNNSSYAISARANDSVLSVLGNAKIETILGNSTTCGLEGKNIYLENITFIAHDTGSTQCSGSINGISTNTFTIKSSDLITNFEGKGRSSANGIKIHFGAPAGGNFLIENCSFTCTIDTNSWQGSSCIDSHESNNETMTIKKSYLDFTNKDPYICYGMETKTIKVDNSIVHLNASGSKSNKSYGLASRSDEHEIKHSTIVFDCDNYGYWSDTQGIKYFATAMIQNCEGVFNADGTDVNVVDGKYKPKIDGKFAIKSNICYTKCDFNGGSGLVTGVNVYDYGTSITLPSAPSREGYIFLGWSDGTDVYDADSGYTVTKSVTFKAVWEPITKTNLPESGSESMSENFFIRGTTTGKTVTVTVNGVQAGSADVSPTGEFEVVVKLSEGDNVIVVYVDDGNGNTAVRTTMVTYEKTDVNTGLLIAFAVSILFTLYIGIVTVRRI